ncbi:hypothetical protein LINPERHAP1_LOCUS12883, partial [Linum perenne]
MLLGDHTSTYLDRYTHSHENQQCTQVISSQNNYITGVIILMIQHLATKHLPTRIALTFIHQPHNSQFTVSQSPTSTKHNQPIHQQALTIKYHFTYTRSYGHTHTPQCTHD